MSNRNRTRGYILAAALLLAVPMLILAYSSKKTPSAQGAEKTPLRMSAHLSRQIGNDTATMCASLIDAVPGLRDGTGEMINGFLLGPDAYAQLSKLHFTQLYFKLGVQNFWDSARIKAHDPSVKVAYTLIVIPLDQDMKQIRDDNGQLVAFDYVCPCVHNVGCCPQPPSDPTVPVISPR